VARARTTPSLSAATRRFAVAGMLWSASAVSAGGCSLIIDVPVSCDDADCLPYLCSDDGITCAATCANDAACTDGFVCDVAAGSCEPTGCVAIGDAVQLAGLPSAIGEFDVAVGYGEAAQMLVVAGNNAGLGFRRYGIDGSLVGDTVDPTLELLRLDSPNGDRLPYLPRLDFEPPSGTFAQRFLFSWRQSTATPQRNSLRTAVFVPVEPVVPVGETAYELGFRLGVTGHHLVSSASGTVWAWVQQDALSEVFALEGQRSGRAASGATPVRLSEEGRNASLVGSARQDDVAYVAFVTSGDGTRGVGGAAVDPNAGLVGSFVLRPDRPSGSFDVPHLSALTLESAAVVAWMERSGQDTAVQFAMLTADATSRLSTTTSLLVPPTSAAPDFTDLSELRAAEGPRGFALSWLGARNQRFDVWVQRFSDAGAPLFKPTPVTGLPGTRIQDFRVVSTDDGFTVVWLTKADATDATDRLFMKRFLCAN